MDRMEDDSIYENSETADASPRRRTRGASGGRRPAARMQQREAGRKPTGLERAQNAIHVIQGAGDREVQKDRITQGNVSYYSGEELNRSPYFPSRFNFVIVVFAVVAAVLGGLLLFEYYDKVIAAQTRTEEAMQQYIATEVDYYTPTISEWAGHDSEFLQYCSNRGYDFMEIDSSGATGIRIVKFPDSIDSDESRALYEKGFSNLSPDEAARLLNGYWEVETDASGAYTIAVRYVDFTCGTLEGAIGKCLTEQGIDESTASEQGVDDSGNTYKTGTVEADGSTYTWRVSAIPFSNVYDAGLPSSAIYVGFRLTAR